jgi:hypothetical protein
LEIKPKVDSGLNDSLYERVSQAKNIVKNGVIIKTDKQKKQDLIEYNEK